MSPRLQLLIAGASTRAAAMSALRAGFASWCADLFADRDLRQIAEVHRISSEAYPNGIADALAAGPSGPWCYTGALENHPSLVDACEVSRESWGNTGDVLRRVRNPVMLAEALRCDAIAVPEIALVPPDIKSDHRWLVKPIKGGGGRGIRPWTGVIVPPDYFCQQWIEGDSASGIFVGRDGSAQLLGVSRQFVGLDWLHAAPWHYCGSVGPIPLLASERSEWLRIGSTLVSRFGLRGLFGVDAIMCDGRPWVIEVNPRYTASVEVIELGCQIPLMAAHAAAFGHNTSCDRLHVLHRWIGKAVYYAPKPFGFPDSGPWDQDLARLFDPWNVPNFADIPAPGELFETGQPVLSILTTGNDEDSCIAALRCRAELVDAIIR